MYDRTTNSIWHQFTGEPVIGPLAHSGIKLSFFPVTLTTWKEWLAEHPDTTVISNDTGLYPATLYVSESDSRAIYYDYFNSPETMFPVPYRSGVLDDKDVVLGVGIGDSFKAYPVAELQRELLVNDIVGGAEIVVIGSSSSQAARAYERDGQVFSLGAASAGLPSTLVDSDGNRWLVTEEFVMNESAPSQKLKRVPTHMSFWFGWYQFHQDTELYTADGE